MSPASVHDVHYLKDIKGQVTDCTLIGDKGYLSEEMNLDLINSANIKLETPMRKNQKNYKKQAPVFRKHRKRIETLLDLNYFDNQYVI